MKYLNANTGKFYCKKVYSREKTTRKKKKTFKLKHIIEFILLKSCMKEKV